MDRRTPFVKCIDSRIPSTLIQQSRTDTDLHRYQGVARRPWAGAGTGHGDRSQARQVFEPAYDLPS